MGIRTLGAQAVSALSTVALKHVFRRPAANFPGKIALYVDPRIIANRTGLLSEGSIVVVGTNGKTTVTNLLADVLEAAGKSVVCNRTGANLDSGIATALLHAKPAQWGVFESDELWLAKSLPQLQANYVLLLNLFRDQLDRCGEIDRIQDSIVDALRAAPRTVLVYNADDPLCAYIADRAAALPERAGVPSIAFGVAADMGLPQNTVSDAQMCQRCSSMFAYDFRQYGQLGAYRCPTCGFARPALDFAAQDVRLAAGGLSFTLAGMTADAETAPAPMELRASLSGAYMVYNLMAVGVAAQLAGCEQTAVQRAIDAFDPQNGRLQRYDLHGRSVLLNLAKNPTGFNQNLKIVAQDTGRKAVAFFINDKEADGHDVSWLWDIDFEELAQSGELVVYAGGIRGRDMQVRLKYAGIDADVVADANEVLDRIERLPQDANAYLIANYTSLPGVKAALDARAQTAPAGAGLDGAAEPAVAATSNAVADGGPFRDFGALLAAEPPRADGAGLVPADRPLRIVHLFPDLLNLYGDGGNVRVLRQRCAWRAIPVEVVEVKHGQEIDLTTADIVFMGGGPDREQKLASEQLLRMRDDLRAYVEGDGVLLAICGGYQILGHEWLWGDDMVEGLGLVDLTTRRPGTSADRLIDNIVLDSPIADQPVVGYENHAGRTYLGAGVEPFGRVVSKVGHGNNDDDHADGVRYRNVVGTYSHGPLLAKNPGVADWLIKRAIEQRTGAVVELPALPDAEELAANRALVERFK